MARRPGKRVMILGAGHEHLPLIRKAVDLGHFVITVDYLPDNVGHRLSHHYVNISTVDATGVLEAARREAIDGILTIASDIAVPTVAFVAGQLGLAGPTPQVARLMTDKAEFRRFQKAAGFEHPDHVTGTSLGAVRARVHELTPPLLCKPTDMSGSRGVTRVDDPRTDELERAFEHARSFSRSGRVCVERFVDGIDVSGDGFLVDGQLAYLVVTRKVTRGLVPTGHRIPAAISVEDERRLRSEVSRTCAAAGQADGPLDFDARLGAAAATIIEMSPRLGGNSIPVLIGRATGSDPLAASLAFALGDPLPLPARVDIRRPCAVYLFGSERPGRLVAVADEATVRSAVPEVFGVTLKHSVGDAVEAFEHSGNSLGWTVFDCPSAKDYDAIVERIRQSLGLVVGDAHVGER